MDTFAQLPASEREAYFTEAAARLRLPPHVVEKDFWVCWTLKRLFTLETVSDTLLFKGGTSLSKVHGLIRRFSEDIDVSIHREKFGFTGEDDPLHPGLSNKKREQLIEKLATAARNYIEDTIHPDLKAAMEAVLPQTEAEPWTLTADPTDPDGQSLAFTFPTTGITQPATSYIRPAVKIEFGARSDHWPAEKLPVQPYVVDVILDAMEEPSVEVKTMVATRTFWEKATILHQMAHLPEEKPFPPRYSRHYTDLVTMIEAGVGNDAAEREDLLEAVVRHKLAFYRAAWARYQDAKRGTLRLLPSESNLRELKADLESMRDMFFDDPPEFEEVVKTLREWGTSFNSSGNTGEEEE